MLNYSEIISLDKAASLGAGISAVRKPTNVKIKPWRDGPDGAMAAAVPGHSGRSTSMMGCSKTAFKMPSFNMPNMTFSGVAKGIQQQAGKAFDGARNAAGGAALVGDAVAGKARSAIGNAKPFTAQQTGNLIDRATGTAGMTANKITPWVQRNAKPLMAGGAATLIGGGAYAAGATPSNLLGHVQNTASTALQGLGNYGQQHAVGHVVNALGGEPQVRDMLTSLGVPVEAGTPLGPQHLQAGMAKMKELQQQHAKGPWGQISSFWQGLDPKMQQAIIAGLGSTVVGGLVGGMPGAMMGGLAGAASPYAYDYVRRHMGQGLTTPTALN